MKTEKHIDLTYLKELSNGSTKFIVEMIDAFLEQTPLEIANLDQGLNRKDWKSIRSIAHKIKPSVTFMGIKELESVVKLIEEYAGNETNLDLLPAMILNLKTVFYSAMEELKEEKELLM